MELERRAESDSSQSTLNPELSHWLDQNQKHFLHENRADFTKPNNHDESSKHELGFLSALYQANLSLYGEIYLQCRLSSRCPPESQKRISQNLERFIFLSEVLEHRKIDLCLSKAPEISDNTVKMLYHVGRTLTKGAASLENFFAKGWSNCALQKYLQEVAAQIEKVRFVLSPGDDSGDIVEDFTVFDDEGLNSPADVQFNKEINTHIANLADLVPTIQGLLHEESQAPWAQEGRTGIMTFHVTDSAKQYVMQIREKYPKASITLVERLGEANWQRYVRIRRKMHQGEGLDEDLEGEKRLHSFQSAFVPTEFHDSGLGSSVTFGPHITRSVASHTSFLSSHSDGGKGRLHIPPTPGEVLDGLPFICSICGHELTSIRNRTEWKIHVFHDLQPYICTSDECCDALTTFPTRKLWADHEFREHRVIRFLKCHCLQTFTNKDTFVNHLKYEHLLLLNRGQLLTQLSAAETAVEQPLHEQQCPLCLQDGSSGRDRWASQRQFVKHVGRHLEEIALASLPRDIDSDTEASSQRSGSSTPVHTSMRNHVHSVSLRSRPGSEIKTKIRLDRPTSIHNASPPSQGLEAQGRGLNDEMLQQSWRPFHKITYPKADVDPRPQTNQQIPTGQRASDHGRWADRLARKADISAVCSSQEAFPSSHAEKPLSQINSTINLVPEIISLERSTSPTHPQQQVQQQTRQNKPHFTLPYGHMQQSATGQLPSYEIDHSLRGNPEKYYDYRETPSYPSNSPRAFQEYLEFQDPTSLGEYNYNSTQTDQHCIENAMKDPYLGFGQPGARRQWLPPFPNCVNPVMQPVNYQGPNPHPVKSAPEPYVDLKFGSNVPWTSDSIALLPNSDNPGNRGYAALQDFNAPGKDSASSEFAQAWPPADATVGPESERVLKRRRFVYEQKPPGDFDYTTLWQGIGNETETLGSRPAALTSQETSSALQVSEAFKNPFRTDAVVPAAPRAASCLPSALPAAGQRGEPSHPSASRASTQVDDPDLNTYLQTISHMYLTEGKTLDEVKKFMAEAHNVVASTKQYKTFLKRAHLKKNFDIDDIGIMVSLRRDLEDRGQRCKIYWCDKEVTQAKIKSYLRKKKLTEAQVLAKAKIPDPLPSYIVVEVLSHNTEASELLPNPSANQPDTNFLEPLLAGLPASRRFSDGAGHPKRRACVACRRSKAKCDFSDGDGSNTRSCIRCRQEHKDCVVRQSRRKRTPPVTRRSGKRKRGMSPTPAASSTSETSTSVDPYNMADSESTRYPNVVAGVNFGSDGSP